MITDSTATVTGAMIIAPLSTPIMGIALGVAKRQGNASLLYVVTGGSLVVGIGVLGSLVVPSGSDLLANSQIASRTSPGLLDLIAAIATGLAGAVAMARRDVAAVLPGVAIAISLVPPLAVVGSASVRARSTSLGALLVLIVLPLAANTVIVYQLNVWQRDVHDVAERWLRDTPDAEVTGSCSPPPPRGSRSVTPVGCHRSTS